MQYIVSWSFLFLPYIYLLTHVAVLCTHFSLSGYMKIPLTMFFMRGIVLLDV